MDGIRNIARVGNDPAITSWPAEVKLSPKQTWTELDKLRAENRFIEGRNETKWNGGRFRKKIDRNTQSGGEKILKHQVIKELHEEYGWPISTLSKIAGITRDAYYKWTHRKTTTYDNEQAELLEAILELEEKHKWTLGYLGMTTQLAFENKLSFKAGLKRVTNCMRNHVIKANIRKKET